MFFFILFLRIFFIFTFTILFIICLSVLLFGFTLFGTLSALSYLELSGPGCFLSQIGHFSIIISSNNLSGPFSLSFPSGTPVYTCYSFQCFPEVFKCIICFLIYFLFYCLVGLGLFHCLSSKLLICGSILSILLLNISNEFFSSFIPFVWYVFICFYIFVKFFSMFIHYSL